MEISGFSRNIAKCALVDAVRCSALYNKAEVYGALDEMGRDLLKREPQRFEKCRLDKMAGARAALCDTPEGAALLKAYAMAKPAPEGHHIAKAAEAATDKQKVEEKIRAAATDIATKEGKPHHLARTLAWQRNPDLKEQYDNILRTNRRSAA